ncbi:MAG: glycosyltransferase, partial [Promethearchaeota archaeon]
SNIVQYYSESFIPNWSHYPTSKFMKTIKTIVDPKVVMDLADKTRILIDNRELRKSMGKAGRERVEKGKFSLNKRNERLKKIFDEAINY